MAAIKKAQTGTSVGNPKGYNAKTSPLANSTNKGGYEKKLDTVGTTAKSVRMIDGKGNVLGQERLGSSGAEKLAQKYKREKANTESRRKTNSEFLESRKKSGVAASKSIGTMKKGGVVKAKNGKSFPDLNKDGKVTKADVLKGRGVIAKKGMKISKKK